MKKLYSLLLLGGLLFFGANNAFADDPQYGWYDISMTIGGRNFDFSTWSGDPSNPTVLGELINMTVTSISFNVWSNKNDRGGANMYFKIYDKNGTKQGDDQDIWLGGATRIAGDHDFSISYSTPVDLAAAVGLTLEEGETYYVDVWAKTYGNGGDEWYSNNSANYHAKFKYVDPNRPVTITAAGWATYCSPFALDLENATGLTDAFIVTGGAAGVLTKTSVMSGTVPANTGLLLKAPAGTVTIPAVANSETDVSSNILTGVTEATGIAAEVGWVLMNDATNGLGFYQNANAFTVGANTAYIPVSKLPVPFAGAPARFLLEDEVNGATDIQSIESADKAVKFIENGRILILRDGITYDALGRIVK